MNKYVMIATVGIVFASAAQAQTPTESPQAQYAAQKKAAAARYASDKTLCNDEATSKARLDCRREAKAQYDAALGEAKSKMAASGQAAAAAARPARAPCVDCGTITDVAINEQAGRGGPVGMIAGGVGGALLGRQLGGGTGKDVATIAGAVGGAYAGKKIEEKVTAKKVWSVTVEYPNNIKKSYRFDQDPGFKVGDPVRDSGGSIVRR